MSENSQITKKSIQDISQSLIENTPTTHDCDTLTCDLTNVEEDMNAHVEVLESFFHRILDDIKNNIKANNKTNYRLYHVVNFDQAISSEKIITNRKDINGLILKFGDNLVLSHQEDQNIYSSVFCHIIADIYYEQLPIMLIGKYKINQ
ncbi:28673_t:CDS:2 [Dentiscutata erythropus]|uniref:28673_t:CDS:1 n=1 Tax=Dentiscutata erythropus TaxID=1348616 RepID=A0A9N8ZHF7_9GLOM|nr:28673_t:CDS:2 [Dentiscutata erythropus]